MKTKEECPFCKGSGMVKSFEFSDKHKLKNGSYDLKFLIDNYGEWVPCIEKDCKKIMN